MQRSSLAVELGGRAGVDQAHPLQPVAQVAAMVFNPRHIAMNDHTERAPREVLGEVPALLFDLLGLGHLLAMGGGGVWVAAIGTHQAVDHQL